MKKSSEHTPLSQFSLLLQGGPKTGKTTLALQFPKPYILDCDNNLEGTMRWRKRMNLANDFLYDTPDVDDSGNERPIRDRYSFSAARLTEAVASPDVTTVIIDGVTKMSAYILSEIQRQQNRKDGEMQLQDWALNDFMWRNLVTKMQACRKMFILIAHEEFSDIPNLPGAVLINMPGKKIQQALPGMFSDVWRCEIKDTLTTTGTTYKWLVRAMPKTGYSLGNSLGLPDVFEADFKTISTALAK